MYQVVSARLDKKELAAVRGLQILERAEIGANVLTVTPSISILYRSDHVDERTE